VFIFVVYFIMDSVRKLLDTTSHLMTDVEPNHEMSCRPMSNISRKIPNTRSVR